MIWFIGFEIVVISLSFSILILCKFVFNKNKYVSDDPMARATLCTIYSCSLLNLFEMEISYGYN